MEHNPSPSTLVHTTISVFCCSCLFSGQTEKLLFIEHWPNLVRKWSGDTFCKNKDWNIFYTLRTIRCLRYLNQDLSELWRTADTFVYYWLHDDCLGIARSNLHLCCSNHSEAVQQMVQNASGVATIQKIDFGYITVLWLLFFYVAKWR